MIEGIATYNRRPVPKTEVKLFEVGIGEVAKTTTDKEGNYSFDFPLDNRYTVELNLYGFLHLIPIVHWNL